MYRNDLTGEGDMDFFFHARTDCSHVTTPGKGRIPVAVRKSVRGRYYRGAGVDG